jgi:glyoxylase-like metal-dependent hydrolase (beta-lactamase superfamily II)
MKTWTTKTGQNIVRVLTGRCNCYLLINGDRHLLIDVGRRSHSARLCARLDRFGVKQESLQAVILTHSHFDHAENSAMIKEKYQTHLIAHRLEVPFLAKGENPPIQGTLPVTKVLTHLLTKPWIVRLVNYPPVPCDLVVDDVLDLERFGFRGRVLHTPGHSPGSVSVIIDDEIALVGDTLFGVWPGSVFPPFAADAKMMIKSWAKLLETECRLVLPGHGGERSRGLLERQIKVYGKKYRV